MRHLSVFEAFRCCWIKSLLVRSRAIRHWHLAIFVAVLGTLPSGALACGFGVPVGGQCRGYLTAGSSFTVPSDWTSTNTIEVIGGGGGGQNASAPSPWGGAGGGGAYSRITNFSLTAGATVNYSVGSGGAASIAGVNVGTAGGDTWFNGAGLFSASVSAQGGQIGNSNVSAQGGAGGAAANGTGGFKYSGGSGAPASQSVNSGGGGGAAGPGGNGGNGGLGFNTTGLGGGGGGGGGGNSAVGGGGGNFNGATGGAAGAGGAGGGGAGGAGATYNASGSTAAAGANGTNWDSSHGAGGGGGGGAGGPFNAAYGANGGLYGAGGGAGGARNNNYTTWAGNGAPGLIVITYTPASGGGGGGVAGATNYAYDTQGRLTCAATPDGYFTSYIFDYADNRAQIVRNTSACITANQSQAPVANNVSATVAENSSNNWITLKITGGTPTSVSVLGSAVHGTATASSAQISYTPTSGYAGSDSFQYSASNSAGTSPAATVSLTVGSTAPGQAPVANSVSTSVLYGSTNNSIPLNITGGTAASVSVLLQPGNGYATANGTSIIYTPTATQPSNGASTSDSFPYEASNKWGTSAAANVSITINPPAPTAHAVQATVGYNSSNNPVSPSVSGSYTSIAVSSQPSHGTAVSNGQTLFYTPNNGYPSSGPSALDGFQYTATYGSVTSAPATASITVNGPPGSNSPTAIADTMNLHGYGTPPGTYAAGCIDPTTNDTSPLGYALTVTGVTGPASASQYSAQTSSSSSPNQVCYYSPYPANITDTFTYSISDGHGGTATGTVTVHVTY